MAAGKTVRVDVTVWGLAFGGSIAVDILDLYYAADASTPGVDAHRHHAHARAPGRRRSRRPTRCPRARCRRCAPASATRAAAAACGAGAYDDHDDLAFAVQ